MKLMIHRVGRIFRGISKVVFAVAVIVTVINLFFYSFRSNKVQVTYDPVKENRKQIYSIINNPALQKNDKDKQVMKIFRASNCILLGEACTDNPSDGDKYYGGSVFGGMAKLMTFPYANPPASGIYWAYTSLEKSGFIPKSYAAQGIGFSALQPLSKLWEMFRNVSYMLVVIVLLAVGFMIMFRVKINPQTMVTLENSLPRIVLTLILITFSFAIGGFMIDLMYVVTGLGVSMMANNGIYNLGPTFQRDIISSGGLAKLFDLVFLNPDTLLVGGAMLSILPTFLNVTVRTLTAGATLWVLNKWPPFGKYLNEGLAGDDATFLGVFGLGISLLTSLVVFPIVFLFSPLLLSIFILITTGLLVFFRILFLLFAAYLRILFSIMFAPLILLGNALPGRNMFMRWIKGLVADLLVFPIVIVLVSVSTIIVNIPRGRGDFWNPPFLYTVDPSAFNILVGIGLLFMIPDIIKSIRGLFGIKDSPLKMGLGTFLAGAGGLAAGTGGVTQKLASLHYSKAGWEVLKGLKEKVTKAPVYGPPAPKR